MSKRKTSKLSDETRTFAPWLTPEDRKRLSQEESKFDQEASFSNPQPVVPTSEGTVYIDFSGSRIKMHPETSTPAKDSDSAEEKLKPRQIIVKKHMKSPTDFDDREKLKALFADLETDKIPVPQPRRRQGKHRTKRLRTGWLTISSRLRKRYIETLKRDLYPRRQKNLRLR